MSEHTFPEVMLDLETMGNGPDAAIVAIGAVAFSLERAEISPSVFYRLVTLESAVRQGGSIEPSTVIWWLQQSDEAREEITRDDLERNAADAQAAPDSRVGEIIEQLRVVCEDGCPPDLPLKAADAMERLLEQRDAAGRNAARFAQERDALRAELDALKRQTSNPAQSVPSVADAEAMGEKGGTAVEGERLAFEAWMRGHCWSLSATWDGRGYIGPSETHGVLCPYAMRTRELWAAWRDRAALAAAPKQEVK